MRSSAFLIVPLFAMVEGCVSGPSSKVFFEESDQSFGLYEFGSRQRPDGGWDYLAAGDTREAFRPAICAPYPVAQTWYVRFSRGGEGAEFAFLTTFGATEAGDPVYVQSIVRDPDWTVGGRYGTHISGSGVAERQEYVWNRELKKLEPRGEPEPAGRISFVLKGSQSPPHVYGILPMFPPAAVSELLLGGLE